MKHKCDGCEHAGKLFGVCLRYGKDIDAQIAYKADKCPFKKTNFDHIKAMSVKKMANFLLVWAVDCMTGKAPMDVQKWLESEVQGE